MKSLFKIIALSSLGCAFAQAAESLSCQQVAAPNIVKLDLSDLAKVPVVLSANQKATCAKQAAGIVTVITGEQIQNMGARDLIDVLQLVPGFSFGVDVSNVVGLGIRGIQAHEGKVAVFVDGISLNEHRFGTTQFGNHFPLEQIDRIEIVRGPGSIVHGNFAEMGVINIISKTAKQMDGVKLSGNYGRFSRGEARKNLEWTAGKQWGDLEVSFSGKRGEAHRSDQIYQDAVGRSFDMTGNNELDATMVNLGVKYQGLNLRLLVDQYNVNSRDGFGEEMSKPGRYLVNKFNTYAADLGFQHHFSPSVKLETNASFSHQNPWERTRKYLDGRAALLREKVYVDYYKFNAKATFASEQGNYLVVGNSFSSNKFDIREGGLGETLPTFSNYTAYTEARYAFPWINVLAGLRFDAYNEYGTNFAPRVALTKDFGRFHVKALYSHAFRIPTGGNYQKNAEYNIGKAPDEQIDQVGPERTRTVELEFGFQPFNNLDLTVNLFHIQSDDIILYQVDDQLDDFYINASGQNTQGVEWGLEYRVPRLGYLAMDYSFYESTRNTADKYKILGSDGQIHQGLNVGFPTHKVSLNGHIDLTPSLSLNQTLIFISDRYGYEGDSLVRHGSSWVYNFYWRYKNLFTKGLNVGLGVYDLFNEKQEYVQPYHGGHPALPGRTREVMFKLSYQF
ncbi:TonB-dependent receptor plug domain-containing protein [Methylomarinum sp. Ch1-1]|uniref:TonB-dependent receptor plug domain-containing protein n=1 Tax=Methylomarinum roseum TaxID=3067653 RepID=A0AAU7NTI8_9GAMM